MLRKSPEALAQQHPQTSQHTGRETTSAVREVNRSGSAHAPLTSHVVQTPSSSLAKPPTLITAPARATASSVEGPRPSGVLASLLQGSQAAEAKAYFTGLLPGKTPPPRPMSANGPRLPAFSTTKAGTAPSFTGFTGKLGSAASGTHKYEFSAVSFP